MNGSRVYVSRAMTANQVEGAYLEDGKGLTIVDLIPTWEKHGLIIKGYVSSFEPLEGEHPSHETINFYNHYKSDAALFAKMGFKALRFSISWVRIFSTGAEETPNEESLRFYDTLFAELKKHGM